MFDIAKCAEAEKYCKDCESCMRYKMPDDRFQCYSQFHECKETNKNKCEFYISDIKIEPIMEWKNDINNDYSYIEKIGKTITMRR